MTTLWERCAKLSDAELIAALKSATAAERHALVSLLVHLSEFEVRRLAAELAYSSLFLYCTKELRYSEDAAYKRIRAARVVRRFPAALEMLESGEIHLAGLVVLSPFLDDENHRELLDRAKGKSKRDIEAIAAEFEPREPRPDSIRHFSTPAPTPKESAAELELGGLGASADEAPPRGAEGEGADGGDASSAEEVSSEARCADPARAGPGDARASGARISFDADDEFLALLERGRAVTRHKYPEGRLRDVLGLALGDMLDKRDMDRRIRRLAAKRARRAERKADQLAPGPVEEKQGES